MHTAQNSFLNYKKKNSLEFRKKKLFIFFEMCLKWYVTHYIDHDNYATKYWKNRLSDPR